MQIETNMAAMGYRNWPLLIVSRLKILCVVYNPAPQSWSAAYSQGRSLLFGIHYQCLQLARKDTELGHSNLHQNK